MNIFLYFSYCLQSFLYINRVHLTGNLVHLHVSLHFHLFLLVYTVLHLHGVKPVSYVYFYLSV